ncbi:hypothetical protein BVC80_8945g23 [Macleaya cordata]|uniref:Uncharacterized protein n=1 Tax=Macleaya cordata TaxID=56857 RepID=A0A200QRC1_MACCD|nr:hypothetical protein BVC80_8945g23 [Macleaya cordata]
MEVENPTRDHPLRSNFTPVIHHKPYKITKEYLTFEIKVTYMRIISSSINMQSYSLNLIFLPRDLHSSCLQINGLNINPSEKISRPLNRHRSDALMSETIYVNTDRIKFKGFSLPFEVQIQDSSSTVLVSGNLRRKVSGFSGGKDDCMWVLECKEGGITEFINGGAVDVYFAGRSLGKPLLLNELVELKKWKGLDFIPDDDDDDETPCDKSKELGEKPNIGGFDEHEYNKNAQHSGYTDVDQIFVEEEEVSLFNAGVRVGIGLGLGMCLSVGVGLGLIVRTYKTTSGAFRKFML